MGTEFTAIRTSGQRMKHDSYSYQLNPELVLHVAAKTMQNESYRKRNEDNYVLCGPTVGVFDGMGGESNGGLASQIAALCLQVYGMQKQRICTEQEMMRSLKDICNLYYFGRAENATNIIHSLSQNLSTYTLKDILADPSCSAHAILKELDSSMGTTAVAAEFKDDGTYDYYGVGDSPLLAVEENGNAGIPFPGRDNLAGEQLERNEISMAQLATSGEKHYLTGFLGSKGLKEDRKLQTSRIVPGVTYILCSDGLIPRNYTSICTGVAEAYQKLQGVKDTLEKTKSVLNFLIEKALAGESTDNITAVVVRAEKRGLLQQVFG